MNGQKIRIFVEGFNQIRLLSAFQNEGVRVGEIERETNGKMSISIAKKDSEKAFAILRKMCYTYRVIFRADSRSMALAMAARSGLIVGLIIFFTALMLLYGFVWRIEIEGLENVNELTVHKALKSNGISLGSSKKMLDKNAIRDTLNSVDGILESGVEIVGTTLKIYVVEDTEFEEHRKENYADILSSYDAVVTRITTRAGTAAVKVGGYVKKGAPLIRAVTTNTLGEEIPSYADGEVYGRVAFMKASEFSLTEYKLRRTGKTYKSTSLSFFGLKINGKNRHGYERFESKQASGNLFEGLLLPIKYTQTNYYEVIEEKLEHTKEEYAERFLAEAIDELVIKAGGAEIESKYTLKALDNERFLVVAYVVAELELGGSLQQ